MITFKVDEAKLLLQTALPLMGAFLAQKGMQIIDTSMMGWIGAKALAAGALGTSLFGVALVFCMGILNAVGVFIARARGARQTHNIHKLFQHGLLLALLLSLPCMLLIWLAPSLLINFNEDPQVINNVILFLHALVWGLPGFLCFFVCREFIAAFNLTRAVLLITLLAIPATFFFNYLFIYGKYGLPALGIAGIGYASALVMWLMFLSLFYYIKKQAMLKNYANIFNFTQTNFTTIKSMLALGMPSGLLLLLDVGLFLCAALFMSHFGTHALAAHQIAIQCATLAYAVPFALAMSIALLISHAVGENDFAKVKRLALLSLMLTLIISGILALIFNFYAVDLIALFLKKTNPHFAEISAIAGSFLSIAALFQCFDALQATLNGILKGLKDTFIPMVVSFGSYWIIGVGSAYFFAFHSRLGAKGIWYGLTLGLCSAGIALSLRYLLKKWQSQ